MKALLAPLLFLLAAGLATDAREGNPDRAPGQAPAAHGAPVKPKQKITPFLWFDDDAEEAIGFYASIFDGSRIVSETRWPKGGPLPEGTLMTATFELAGQQFMALNGGPQFRFNEAVSLLVSCADQAEIDALWTKLCADGGEPGRCGWLKDRYGLSWQVVPSALGELLADPDPARAKRVTEAMLGMQKLDLERLQRARDGR